MFRSPSPTTVRAEVFPIILILRQAQDRVRKAYRRKPPHGPSIPQGEREQAEVSGGFGVKKPDLRIFQACLSALEVEPADATFVGDDLAADIEPALALGMRAVWKSPRHSPKATFCSDGIAEICAYLLQAGPALRRPEAQR